ncbi:MAG: hypothetical protein MUW51_08725 [Lactococcus lactis]|nr:hypothetical protein [Lactococcus lactis]
MIETEKERIYREALEEVSRSLPVNSKLDLVIAEALIKAKYLPITTDKLSVEKLQERCDRYEKALTNIKWRTERDELETYYVERNQDIRKDAIEALAAIGGENESLDN